MKLLQGRGDVANDLACIGLCEPPHPPQAVKQLSPGEHLHDKEVRVAKRGAVDKHRVQRHNVFVPADGVIVDLRVKVAAVPTTCRRQQLNHLAREGGRD